MPDILSLAIDNLLCWVCKLAGVRDKTKGCRPICPAPYGHRSRIRADGALRHVNRSKGNIPQRQIWQRPRCAVPYIREGHSARYPLPMDSMACERGQTVGSTRRYLVGKDGIPMCAGRAPEHVATLRSLMIRLNSSPCRERENRRG